VFRPFEAFFAFWRRKSWGGRNTDGSSGYFSALAPIFARSKSEKCFKPAESPTETLAKQATERVVGQTPKKFSQFSEKIVS